MALTRPTLSSIISRLKTYVESRSGLDTSLPRGNTISFIGAFSGLINEIYGYVVEVSLLLMPDRAAGWFLRRWMSIYGLTARAATKAAGTITATGTPATAIPIDTVWTRVDGVRFISTAAATISGAGTATVSIEAVEAGVGGNTTAGGTLTLESALSGVDDAATIVSLTGGTAAETEKAQRARLLTRIRKPPHGGNANDYDVWVKEAMTSATRVWVLPLRLGRGTVGVTFVKDGETPIIPTAADVDTVQTYIGSTTPITNDPGVRPVTARVFVFAPTAYPVAFTIAGIDPDTPDVRESIEAELTDLFLTESEFEGTMLLSHMRETISRAAGENDHSLTSPAADVTAPAGTIHTLGAVSFT